MERLGEKIRKFREEKQLPLRTVAAYVDIDQAILSKIERGNRKATRELVIKLAEYFNADKNELLITWLSDKLVDELEDEETALQALQMAEEKMTYLTKPKLDKANIIQSIKSFLQNDGRVIAAWLFGSFAR